MIAFKAAIAATAILVFTVVADAAYAPLRTADDDAGSGPAKMRKIQLKERPLVNSDSLRNLIHISALKRGAIDIEAIANASLGVNREVGSSGHGKTIEYIHDKLKRHEDYYHVELQQVTAEIMQSELVLNDWKPIYATFGLTSNRGVAEGHLRRVGGNGCDDADYTDPKINGSLLLVPTDACPDLEDPWYSSDLKKHDLAVKHGAKAVIYCDEDDEDNQRSVWGNSDHVNSNDNMNTLGNRTWLRVPTIDLRPASVQELFKLLKEAGQKGQPITAKLTHGMKNVTTHNIHATTRIGNASSILHLGAHSDSVPPGPGLNDNASGSIALLEIATALTNFTTCNTVRFSWWTAEEVNLGGSEYYVKTLPAEDKAKTKLYLNFDMIASPNFAVQLDGPLSAGWNHSSGMPQLAHKVFAHYFKDIAGGNYTDVPRVGEERVQVGRSDHDPFIAAGMAAMSVQTGAGSNKTVEEVELFGGRADAPYDPNYHQKGDTVQNMNMGIWEIMARGAAHVVAVFGRSFEDPDAKHSDMGV